MSRRHATIPYSIWALGIATFLINASSVIVFGLSAVYMKSTLGIHTGFIGFLEGAVEACSYIIKLFSGVISDYMRRRKAVMVFGFALAILGRPLMAMSSSFSLVFMARIFDRIGNGLQSTPRDALVADLSPVEIKGSCYGLRQALGTAGSFAGGILGIFAMLWTHQNFQKVFWIATIPAVLALIALIVFVREPDKQPMLSSTMATRLSWKDLNRLNKPFWTLILIAFVFMLARIGEAMLILHAHQNHGLSQSYTPLILILYNGSNALASYPIGRFSDFIPRTYLLLLGFLLLIAADLVLVFAGSLIAVMGGVILWGMQIGITQSMFLALIADKVPEDLRGTAFGFFYFTTAISLLLAGTLGGMLAHHYGEWAMFLGSACIGALASILLIIHSFVTRSI